MAKKCSSDIAMRIYSKLVTDADGVPKQCLFNTMLIKIIDIIDPNFIDTLIDDLIYVLEKHNRIQRKGPD